MKQPVNRIEAEITQWQAKEQRLGRLFSTALLGSTEFQKEKLAFYERLASGFGNGRGLSEQERFALRMAKAEKARLEKQLYPSFLVRLVRTGLKSILKPALDQKREIEMASNERHLLAIIGKMGIQDASGSLARQMRRGERQFSVPATAYIEDGKRIEFQVGFELNDNGQYMLGEYKAAIKPEGREAISQSFSYRQFPGLDAQQVGNLLEGRAVLHDNTWLQLDQNDKDRDGNYRVKQFQPQYGFDLEKELANWPSKELKDERLKQQVLNSLRQGGDTRVALETGKGTVEFVLQVNPQFKTIVALNEKGSKLSLAQVLGNRQKTERQRVQTKSVMRMSKARSLSAG